MLSGAVSRLRRRAAIGGAMLALIASASGAAAAPGILHGTNDLTNFKDGAYALDVTDMKVKVQGGFVHATRSWADGRWQFNRRWADLDIVVRPESGVLGSDQTHWVERNGAMFHNGASSWLGSGLERAAANHRPRGR